MHHLKVAVLSALLGALLTSAIPTCLSQQAREFHVIVCASNPVPSMPARDVKMLFLKRRKHWDNGLEVMPVDLPVKSAVREAFSQQVLGRSAKEVDSYWQAQVFSGRTSAPAERSTDEAVLAYVRSNPGAIGYVSADSDLTGVKVLNVS